MDTPDSPLVAVVNHDQAVLKMLRYILEHEGYRALVYQVSSDAYDGIKESKPDVTLLDVPAHRIREFLPLVETLKADPSTRHIPVIVSTPLEHVRRDIQQRFGDQRVYALDKPFEIRDLLDCISRVLAGSERKE